MSTDLSPAFAVSDDENLRERIEALEATMLHMHADQIVIEPKHHFAAGMYAREILIPAGCTLTGKIHRHEHINVISKGDISVLTENGIERIQAPATIISKPGTKRVGYAHEDTIWTTFHPNEDDCRDLDILEARLIAPSHSVLTEKELKCLTKGV